MPLNKICRSQVVGGDKCCFQLEIIPKLKQFNPDSMGVDTEQFLLYNSEATAPKE